VTNILTQLKMRRDSVPVAQPSCYNDRSDGCVGVLSHQQLFYGGPDLLRSVRYMIVPQVSVSRRGTQTTMSEKPPNHRQRLIAHGSMAGERMAQIMESSLG
jgi:hypothetical protein